MATKDEAPPDKSWINTIWDAPPKIIKDVAYVINGEKPNSIPIAPKIIPKGTTGIKSGDISSKPFLKIANFDDIIYWLIRAFNKYFLSNLQSL